MPEYLVSLPGLSGSAPGNWSPKGNFPKEEEETQQIKILISVLCRHWDAYYEPSLRVTAMARNGTGTRAGWCRHMGWELLLGLVCLVVETSFRPLCAPSSKHCRMWNRWQGEWRAQSARPGWSPEGGFSDWSIQEEPFQATSETVFLGDLFFPFLFTIWKSLWDDSLSPCR